MKKIILIAFAALALVGAGSASASISMHGRVVDTNGSGCGYIPNCMAIIFQSNTVDFWGNPTNYHLYRVVSIPPGSNGYWTTSGLPTSDPPGDWYKEYGRAQGSCGYIFTDLFSIGPVGWQQNGWDYNAGTRTLYRGGAPMAPAGAPLGGVPNIAC